MSAVGRSHAHQNQTNCLAWSAAIEATKQPLRLDISEAVTTTPDDIIERAPCRAHASAHDSYSVLSATVAIWIIVERKKGALSTRDAGNCRSCILARAAYKVPPSLRDLQPRGAKTMPIRPTEFPLLAHTAALAAVKALVVSSQPRGRGEERRAQACDRGVKKDCRRSFDDCRRRGSRNRNRPRG
uniref:Uncharacterized protein n=1 Tax=Plectus sambesii TaxID=2011161 RepID=A0A914WWQ3_9BILA